MATAKKSVAPLKKAGTASPKTARKQALTRPAPKPLVAKKAVAQPAPTPKPEKPVKAKKPKLVRDSFTIPKNEYGVLDELKQRASALARPVKKSELLRAGIKALAAMNDVAFLVTLAEVPAIKTGRPSAV
ncbi:hypothetical protein [Polaromonas sp. SM01]|uniref:hypothetical protein n=1 Tax=Polaromonas sp. SM01 TaxID=3085630 RepID=UPI002980B799|nr:hypothetical protein [Polaromonas sp. SM01]MDW5444934.1 hypothetical protein [Polaromonas sp. SM01]